MPGIMPGLLPLHPIYRGLRALSRWQHFIEQRLTPLGRFTLAAGFAAGLFGIDTRMNLLYQAFAFAVALLLVGGLSAKLIQRRLRGKFRASRVLPRSTNVGACVGYAIEISVSDRKLVSGCFIEERLPDPRPSLESFLHDRLPDDGESNRSGIPKSSSACGNTAAAIRRAISIGLAGQDRASRKSRSTKTNSLPAMLSSSTASPPTAWTPASRRRSALQRPCASPFRTVKACWI